MPISITQRSCLLADDRSISVKHLAHQFDDLGQQREADTLGMWAFLATELMFFGAMFLGFTVYRIYYRADFAEASRHLNLWLGTANTGVLLCSSLTVALAVHAASHDHRRDLVRFLLATMGLGVTFLCIKGTEYYLEYREGLMPGLNWQHNGANAPTIRLFMNFYFIMTAIHATHMLIGLGVFGVITFQAWRGKYSSAYFNPVEISGLYWHFVDLIWIFLFPLLYLLRS
jgi:cytochrome c oxidase subunit III